MHASARWQAPPLHNSAVVSTKWLIDECHAWLRRAVGGVLLLSFAPSFLLFFLLHSVNRLDYSGNDIIAGIMIRW